MSLAWTPADCLCACSFHPCFDASLPETAGAVTFPFAFEPHAAVLQGKSAAVLACFAAIMTTSAAALALPAPIQPSAAPD
jgi:hypothetical protein